MRAIKPIQLMECYRGSIAHNLYVPPEDKMGTDDVDLLRVYAMPEKYYFDLEGYDRKDETYQKWEGNKDIVAYEVRKMMHLLAGMNPNVICSLYTRKQEYTLLTPEWKHIMDNRHAFVSKNLIHNTFGGYAYSQITQMEKNQKEGYMGEKRTKILKKFGYDIKNASHLIRLLKMGTEFLEDGKPIVYRIKDRDELLSIKRGEWKLKQIKDYSSELFKKFHEAFEKSKLPSKNNPKKINNLLYDIFLSLYQ